MTLARPEPPTAPHLVRALGLLDVVVLNVVAVVSLRWIARGARMGAPSVLLWLLACLAFFLPLAYAVIVLSRRFPDQGGIYAWTRRALGPRHAFLCGWCLWVNNLFYFPSLLLFGAASALAGWGGGAPGVGENRAFSVAFVLAGLWLCVGLNVLGLQRAKWLQNLGSLGTWVPAALLIGCGLAAGALFGSATSFAPRELLPRGDFLSTLGLWSAMCFAFSGIEIAAMMGQEVKDPVRTIPRGVMIAGAAAMVVYILGSASVLIAVPSAALQELSGVPDALDAVGARVGLPVLGGLTGLLVALGVLAGTSSWTAGAARVPFAAGVDRVLPAAFARIHPRWRTPHVALIVQGLASTAVFLLSAFLTVSGRRATLQEAYDVLVNLTILIYFIPYLYLFLALARLGGGDPDAAALAGRGASGGRSDELREARGQAEPRPLPPGRRRAAAPVALVGLLSTGISIGLVFVPPPGTTNAVAYELSLVLQAAGVVAVGVLFYRASGRTRGV